LIALAFLLATRGAAFAVFVAPVVAAPFVVVATRILTVAVVTPDVVLVVSTSVEEGRVRMTELSVVVLAAG